MVASTTEFALAMVKALSEKYGFDETEAVTFLELSTTKVSRAEPKAKRVPKEKKAKKMVTPSMPLPFCGVVMDNWCKGIRPNHELFTQCTMSPKGGSYCATCAGQAETNDTDKPTHGDIRDRAVAGEDWRTPVGKQPVNFGNVMSKREIAKEAAVTEAATFGWVIPEEQFEVKARKAGRPKSPSTSDTEDDAPKKKRASKKKKATGEECEDLIGQLVSNLADESDASSDTSSSDDEESVPVEETKEEPVPVEEQVSVEEPVETNNVKKTKKVKMELTEEEKVAKKAATAAKRKATAAKKKAAAVEAVEVEAVEVEAVEVEAVDEVEAVEVEAVEDDETEDADDEESDKE